MPKLPPINLNRVRVPLAEDYEKLKGVHIFVFTQVDHELFFILFLVNTGSYMMLVLLADFCLRYITYHVNRHSFQNFRGKRQASC